jgi:signal transduction histidine kinase/CheY-like chemotaxis protein/HPt (histidine-containing phosphotransfer) domain-containing protein
VLFSFGLCLWNALSGVGKIDEHEKVFSITLLHSAVVVVQIMLIRYIRWLRDLSFLMPALIFITICTGFLLFNSGTGFFWTLLLISYGIGALYNGFFKLLYFFICSQIALFIIYEMGTRVTSLNFDWDEIYLWIPITTGAFIYLLLTHLLMLRSRTANHGKSLSEMLLITTPNSLVLVDSLMCIIAVSNTFTHLFHIEDESLIIGRPLVDVLPGESKLLVAEFTKSDLYYETIKKLDIYNTTGYFRIMCDKLRGRTKGLFINFVDITPIMKAKLEVERAAKAKNVFLAKMSHEIRTPLNAITGMSELILREDISARVREYAAGVQNAGTNLISITNDILDFSKIESGTMEIIEKRYEVETLLNDVINIIRMRLLEKPILFITNIDSSIPAMLIGDVVRIRQILINVLSNATKYTDSGFITFKLTCQKQGENSIILDIVISDSGRGIRQEDFSRVFGEFVQLDLRQNAGIEGTGLGLAITRSLCKAMGGTISLQSEYGRGSTFTITIPQRVSDARPIAKIDNPETKKVLVYEGRQLYAQSISESLNNLGVPHVVVSSFSALNETLCGKEDASGNVGDLEEQDSPWQYIFVVSIFYESVLECLQRHKLKTHLVALAEVNAIIANDVQALPMPAHTISIARVLNNMMGSSGIDSGANLGITWIAPDVNVLIVDDINTNIVVAEGLMSPYKMCIKGALSGKDALAMVNEQKYDLIFMDHMMPGMDGIETVMRLRKIPNADGVPIIALTANAIQGVEEMFKQNGFCDLLVKPIEVQKLTMLLEKWVPQEKRQKCDNYLLNAAQHVAKTAALAGALDQPSLPRNTAVAAPLKESGSDSLLELNGIDTALGIKNAGGTPGFYYKVLNIYHDEGVNLLQKLNNCLKERDIKLWTTYTHGIKSSSANIGAQAVSDAARHLEEAGKAHNWNFIDDNSEAFFASFSAVLDTVKQALGKTENSALNSTTTGDNTEYDVNLPDYKLLIERLETFSEAADAINNMTMEEVLSELESQVWNNDAISSALEKIQSSVLLGEYREASNLAAILKDNLPPPPPNI